VQAAGLSGIVAIIFCGITMDRAAKAHLNRGSCRHMESFFHVTANLAELFVFIYIGTMLFIDTQEWHIWGFLVGAHTDSSASLAPVRPDASLAWWHS
jgi:NhaP-type Na+/H+ or K+/H+ antiporter